MPTLMNIFSYHIYFWSNEQEPLEPVHIHISEGNPAPNGTKYWINNDGTIEQANNNSRIPSKELKRIEKVLCEYTDEIIRKWKEYFKEEPRFHNEAQTPFDDDIILCNQIDERK